MTKKRLVMRRQLGKIDPPKPYKFLEEMPRVQYVYFEYRRVIADCYMQKEFLGNDDAGYCLDSQVDTHMRSASHVGVVKADFPKDSTPTLSPADIARMLEESSRLRYDNDVWGRGNVSTRPRDPNYRMGSFNDRIGRIRF